MSALTNYTEDAIIGHLFRGTTFTAPTTLYVGLFTAAPGEAGGGTEAAYTGYARASVSNASAQWAATSSGNGTTSNINTITVGSAATSGPAVVTHWGIFDASTGGNLLIYAALGTSKTINSGDPAPSFAAGTLTFQIDN